MSKTMNRPWTTEERALLLQLRAQHLDWEAIAARCHHTAGSCQTIHSRIICTQRKQAAGTQPKKIRKPWSAADVEKLIRLRETERMIWADIDRDLGRPEGSSCAKYDSLRRAKSQVSKLGGGGRIDSTAAEREREARKRLSHSSLTAALFGDPLPGFSALDKIRAGIVDPPHVDHRTAQAAGRSKVTLATEPLR